MNMLRHYLVLTALIFSSCSTHSQTFDSSQELLGTTKHGKPNIVFILTDDQDLHMNSLSYMPYLQKHLIEHGTSFQRHYCTIALCCPSRVSLWTGKAAHNTNVTDVNPPYGGYPKFVSQGFNQAWLPVWLQNAGYKTYYTGKLFNAHTIDNYDSPYPAGFTGSDFLLDPYTYQYLNATFQRDNESPVSHEGEYSTDVLAQKAYGFLEEAILSEDPFFLTIAANAPHSNVEFRKSFFEGNITEDDIYLSAPISATRHKHLFKDVVIPRSPKFNPDEPSSVSWISQLPQQNQSNLDSNDHFYRQRLRALQAVDEIIDGVVSRLSDAGILEDTYIFYSTDNGYHIGQHRLQPGKECGFEEDINVPLIIRGPGVPRGQTSDIVTSHTDLAPTFLSLAGGEIRSDFDGLAIPLSSVGLKEAKESRHEHVNVEYWGFALSEGKYGKAIYWNNTYKALRIIGEDYNFYYSVWCSGEHELYDLNTDPYQINNVYSRNHSSITISFDTNAQGARLVQQKSHARVKTKNHETNLAHLLPRLDALLLVLKTCKSETCIKPWAVLHPQNDVQNLHDALDSRFDEFYEVQQSRVSFSKCERGYIKESEGPLVAKSFGVDSPDTTWDDIERRLEFDIKRVGVRGGSLWSELV